MAHRANLVRELSQLIHGAIADDDVIMALRRVFDCLDGGGSPAAMVDRLCATQDIIQSKDLGGFAGAHYVTASLFELVLAANGEDIRDLPPLRIERLSAANPLRILPDGNLADWKHATSNDYFELQAHEALLNPRRRGRPPGARARTPIRRRSRISEECARDTAAMALPAWVAKWAPDLDISDARDLNRARGRFNSAVTRRRLNERAVEKP